jgi:hypothetical protein
MPLNAATLAGEVRKLTDPLYPAFEGWPATAAESASRWAAAARVFFADAVSPTATFLAVLEPCSMAFEQTLVASLASPGGVAGLVGLDNAFVAWASAACASMPTCTPPPGVPGFAMLPPIPVSASAAANNMAALVYTWAVQGTETIPGTPPVVRPWG